MIGGIVVVCAMYIGCLKGCFLMSAHVVCSSYELFNEYVIVQQGTGV